MATPVRTPYSFSHVVFAGLAFGVGMGAFLYWQTGSAYYGFHGGFWSGAAFGWAIQRFLKITVKPPPRVLDGRAEGFDEGETVVHWGAANHWKGLEAVGGTLYLTDRRLRFRSHKLNIQNHDASYPLSDIDRAEPGRTLGIVPNGLLVWMKDGRRERFVVSRREAWVTAVTAARAPRPLSS